MLALGRQANVRRIYRRPNQHPVERPERLTKFKLWLYTLQWATSILVIIFASQEELVMVKWMILAYVPLAFTIQKGPSLNVSNDVEALSCG
jgi:hypothetical protein